MSNLDALLEDAFNEELPAWKKLKKEILSNKLQDYKNQYRSLGNYQIVHVILDQNDLPVSRQTEDGIETFFVVTSKSLLNRFEHVHNLENIQNPNAIIQKNNYKLKSIMLGEFASQLKERKSPAVIKINPILFQESETEKASYLCEEIIVAPIFDPHTKKFMTSEPDEGKALFAIPADDEKRFGIEMVFHVITNRNLPDPVEREKREDVLKEKMEELAFTIPRVPIKKGSASLFLVILNLENSMEESAFIRTYKTFDPYSNVIFVTSSLKIMTGELDSIPYDSDTIDQVFTPLIDWQMKVQRERS